MKSEMLPSCDFFFFKFQYALIKEKGCNASSTYCNLRIVISSTRSINILQSEADIMLCQDV